MADQLPELWIFADESGDPSVAVRVGDSQFFHVGIATLGAEPSPATVQTALANLKADPDTKGNPQDEKCLKRSYFHACEDSKNGHSHWCSQIAAVAPIEFEMLSFDKALAKGEESLLNQDSAMHHQMVELLAVRATTQKVHRVHLRVAVREGTFPAGIAVWWKQQFRRRLTGSAADLPQIPMFFPDLDAQVVGPEVPGIQVCDFLLWAELRRSGPKPVATCRWAERVGLKRHTGWGEVDGPLGGKEFYVGGRIPVLSTELVPMASIKKPDDSPSNVQLANLLAWVEANIQHVATNGLPSHAHHLQDEVVDLAGKLRVPVIPLSTVRALAATFLCLVDTVPLYDPNNPKEVHFAIDAKHMLGIVYLQRDIRWFTIAKWWANVRAAVAVNQPSALGWS